MSIPITIVDAFVTDDAFTGNPAAVCILPPGGCDAAGVESRFLEIASEMNLSETAFVAPIEDPESAAGWMLRWFTPGEEVELCGHATIASAHTLREKGLADATDPIVFRTRHRGDLVAVRTDGYESVGLPASPLEEVASPDRRLFEGLDIEPVRVVRTLEDDLVLVLDDPGVIERNDARHAAARRGEGPRDRGDGAGPRSSGRGLGGQPLLRARTSRSTRIRSPVRCTRASDCSGGTTSGRRSSTLAGRPARAEGSGWTRPPPTRGSSASRVGLDWCWTVAFWVEVSAWSFIAQARADRRDPAYRDLPVSGPAARAGYDPRHRRTIEIHDVRTCSDHRDLRDSHRRPA